MLGLQNNIKVTIIRNAAGSQSGPIMTGCRDASPSYYCAARLSSELPSSCGANTRGLYDPSMPHKVINIMNYFSAPSSDFYAFDRFNLTNQLDLQCELSAGDELLCIWKPLFALNPSQWFSAAPLAAKSLSTSTPSTGTSASANVTSKNPASSPLYRFAKLK